MMSSESFPVIASVMQVMAALLSALYGNPLVAQPDDGRIKIGLVSSGVVRSWHAVEGRRKRVSLLGCDE